PCYSRRNRHFFPLAICMRDQLRLLFRKSESHPAIRTSLPDRGFPAGCGHTQEPVCSTSIITPEVPVTRLFLSNSTIVTSPCSLSVRRSGRVLLFAPLILTLAAPPTRAADPPPPPRSLLLNTGGALMVVGGGKMSDTVRS